MYFTRGFIFSIFQSTCILFLVCGFSFTSVFAECDTCQNAPQEFEKYLTTFETNVALLLQATGETQQSGGILSNSAKAVKNTINQAQMMLLLSEILFSGPGEIRSDLKMSNKSDAQKRERDRLLLIDETISNASRIFIQKNLYNNIISNDVALQLDTFFQNLGGWIHLKKLADGTYDIVSQGTTYRELAKFLWGLNMFIKQSHTARWHTDLLQDIGKNVNIESHQSQETLQKQRALDIELFHKFRNIEGKQRDYIIKQSVTQNNQRSLAQEWLEIDRDLFLVWARNIEKSYRCAEGLSNECNDLKRIRQENRKLTKDRVIKDTKSAITTIIDATQRLGALLRIGSDEQIEAVNQRKRELLHSQRGAETDRRLETGYINRATKSISSFRKKITQSEQKSQDPVNTSSDKELVGSRTPSGEKEISGNPDPGQYTTIDQMNSLISSVKEKVDTEPQDLQGSNAVNFDDKNKQDNTLLRKNFISQSVIGILELQDSMIKESIYYDPQRVTQNFPSLSRKVYETIDTIGRKNQEATLVWHMGKVCELQCSNLDGRCRAEQD